jgi:acyl-CoA synthetase (AMP-forming)/AMP-acid ligase II
MGGLRGINLNLSVCLEKMAQRISNKIGLRCEGKRYTFHDLNHLSNRVDRKKDSIIRGGYNVYPREVEEVVLMHPHVAEAAVYGVPHEDLGEEVAAAVVLKANNVIEEDLRRFVQERIAPYKYPQMIRIVKELPKNHTGKVLKTKLREQSFSL